MFRNLHESIWQMVDNIPYFPNPLIDYMVDTLTLEMEYSVYKAQCNIDTKIECHRIDPKQVTVADVVTYVKELSASMVGVALTTVDQLVIKLSERLIGARFGHAHTILHVRRFIEYFYNKLMNDDKRRKTRAKIPIRLQRLLSIRIFLSLYISMYKFIHSCDHEIILNRAELCANNLAVPRFKSLTTFIPPLD